MELHIMDLSTLEAIVNLQLADIEEMRLAHEAEQREGATDADVALQLYAQDVHETLDRLTDQRLSQRVSYVQEDDGAVRELLEQHDQRTREAASGSQDHQNASLRAEDINEEHGAPMNIWAGVSMLEVEATSPTQDLMTFEDRESGRSAQPSTTRGEEELIPECIACGGRFNEVVRVPCDHEYCRDCLAELFRLSITDESLFPPRCCRQQIDIGSVKSYLDPKFVEEFAEKSVELQTKDRTYCFEPACATFIPPYAITESVGTCPSCQKTTCTLCKGVSHSGDCPLDGPMQQLLGLADAMQWQRCYQCQRIVELDTGCNHITCPCRAEFCYVCGLRWKTCQCPQWQEGQLFARAVGFVNRDPNHHLFAPPRAAHAQPDGHEYQLAPAANNDAAVFADQQRQIEAAVAHLRENHDCADHQWVRVNGGHICDECHFYLANYIFQCSNCRMRACLRCRLTRL